MPFPQQNSNLPSGTFFYEYFSQPANSTVYYWKSAQPYKGTLSVINTSTNADLTITMIATRAGEASLTQLILPGQAKSISSHNLTGLAIKCSGGTGTCTGQFLLSSSPDEIGWPVFVQNCGTSESYWKTDYPVPVSVELRHTGDSTNCSFTATLLQNGLPNQTITVNPGESKVLSSGYATGLNIYCSGGTSGVCQGDGTILIEEPGVIPSSG